MPPTSATRRLVAGTLAVLALAAGASSACAGSSDDAAVPGTTAGTAARPATTTIPTTEVPETAPATSAPASRPTTTTGAIPPSPSSLPPSVEGPCRALAETVGLDELRPIDSSSWVDERQRVVVDARRERDLLLAAGDGAPTVIVAPLGTMATYAGWVADTVQASSGYAEAVTEIDAYDDRAEVEAADATVSSWRRTNCP